MKEIVSTTYCGTGNVIGMRRPLKSKTKKITGTSKVIRTGKLKIALAVE
jgi:hypothetical protein